MFNNLQLLQAVDIFKLACFKLFYKCENRIIPDYFKNMFLTNEHTQRLQSNQWTHREITTYPMGTELDAYHLRRGFMQKTANKVVYNDGQRLLFAYPFPDVAALMDLLYISRSSAVRPTLHSQVHHNLTTSFLHYLWSSAVSLALYFSFLQCLVSFKCPK